MNKPVVFHETVSLISPFDMFIRRVEASKQPSGLQKGRRARHDYSNLFVLRILCGAYGKVPNDVDWLATYPHYCESLSVRLDFRPCISVCRMI